MLSTPKLAPSVRSVRVNPLAPCGHKQQQEEIGGPRPCVEQVWGLHFSRRSFFFFTPSPDEMQAHAGKAGRESHLADGAAPPLAGLLGAVADVPEMLTADGGGSFTGTPVLFLQLYWKSKTVLK